MRNKMNLKLVPFYTENPGDNNSFTLCIDANTNDIYKAEDKEISASYFMLIFFLVLIFTRLFSIELIPLNNILLFVLTCLFISVIGMVLGYNMRIKMLKNIRKVAFKKKEWKRYLDKSKHFYPRQFFLASFLLIFTVICFTFLFIMPSKWWFFGGIASSILAGSQITLLSKTRYLLYKKKLDINFKDDVGVDK